MLTGERAWSSAAPVIIQVRLAIWCCSCPEEDLLGTQSQGGGARAPVTPIFIHVVERCNVLAVPDIVADPELAVPPGKMDRLCDMQCCRHACSIFKQGQRWMFEYVNVASIVSLVVP